ncbi:Beta sliding clamp [Fusobacterium sp. DD29]|uniref:DNA polymerase III subunit beta n=1 Tax=unclassified Fusobacterium TaxID=2648384 RepID=UPI001B8D74D0|nr:MULTISPECIES: DNA polymerase III subunit beta [unclassified Fusobacterium]MBR8700712.1 Beta sliding clamp [Fusobacterium sp. DD45]MBR8710448.1 Beta sliding clamp [Fusobacterium sp. DD28]MBR8749879.1 Beta sliding clamp [Fusobacterium sp. DD29]MBR8751002.1 Beta sliding clamp [Fusobacterium sp. DD26]MBR8762121.1 Beta sliding clamp [Fusobacterium sp. DD25]
MKIKINRAEFLKRLKIIEKTITENKIKPVISCAYIETREDKLFFCGTNLETTITTEMPCIEIVEEGKIVFQHQLVEEYLKEIKDEEISLLEDNGNLSVVSSDSVSEFSLMDAEDYPKIPVGEKFDEITEQFEIDSEDLASIFEKVKYAASPTSDNLAFNCVRLEKKDNTLKFVTTDTYRLVYLTKEVEKINGDLDISIPLSTVESVTKLLRGIENAKLKFYFINKQIFFKMEDVLVISRVIDLPFPNYRGILENDAYDKKLTINAEQFIKILKRIMIFVRNNSESKYGATFKIGQKEMKINGINEIAKINEEVEVEYEGQEIRIALNTKFLFEYIQNLEKESTITLEFIQSNSSVRIQKEGDDKYLYILMPLALRD